MGVAEVAAREAALTEANARWNSAFGAAVAAWATAYNSSHQLSEAWSARVEAMVALGQEDGAADEDAAEIDAEWAAFQDEALAQINHMTRTATAAWTGRTAAAALADCTRLRRHALAILPVAGAFASAHNCPTGPTVDSDTREVRSRGEHIEKID